MPLQQSNMVPLGTAMPAFTLPDVTTGQSISSASLDPAKPVLVLFICAHCPFTRQIAPGIRAIARDFRDRVNLVAISANDPAQVPDDAPDGLKRLAETLDLRAPFLFDESQTIGSAFRAECTPECFLYDSGRQLVYRGEIEATRPGRAAGTSGAPLRAALDALLAGTPIDPQQQPGVGCNIKWRAGAAAAR
jgi:peroxiredoxin